MDLFDCIESTRFLGEEWLIWLWYRSEREEGLFTLSDGSQVEFHFDNQLTLEAQLAEAERSRLSGGAPSFSTEAKEALRSGKMVSQAKVRLVRDGREWVMSIVGRSLAISGMKIPAVLTREEDEKFFERQALLEEGDALLRGLFEAFLQVRLDLSAWNEEVDAIRRWTRAGH